MYVDADIFHKQPIFAAWICGTVNERRFKRTIVYTCLTRCSNIIVYATEASFAESCFVFSLFSVIVDQEGTRGFTEVAIRGVSMHVSAEGSFFFGRCKHGYVPA